MNRKYSKAAGFYFETKKDFFDENDRLLKRALDQNKLYSAQPQRQNCKLCSTALSGKPDFRQHGVEYVFCEACGHLNGIYEDSKSFIEKLYATDDGKDYARNYLDENYIKRTTDIYAPKVDFLLSSLPQRRYRLLDVGCGSGFFVYAALLSNIETSGVDIGRAMIEFGNANISRLLDKRPLQCVDEDGFYEAVRHAEVDIVSTIGVIEHLREPHRLFDAFRRGNARYLYYSVPMFSFSAILENLFPDIFPRQLSGAHTHLFTERSISMMHSIMGAEPVAEWRFGTDIMDLYRTCATALRKNNVSDTVLAHLKTGFASQIDDLQSTLDRNNFCSEIHCVVSKR